MIKKMTPHDRIIEEFAAEEEAAIAADEARIVEYGPGDFYPRSRERTAEQRQSDAGIRRMRAEVDRQEAYGRWLGDPARLAEELARIDLGEQQADMVDAAEAAEVPKVGPN